MKRLIYNLMPLAFLIFIWQLGFEKSQGIGIPSFFETISSFIMNFNELSIHIGVSILRLLAANLIAMFFGTIIGYLIGKHRLLDALLSPSIYALIPVPKVAFLPLFMILFGIGEKARILLLTFILIFQYVVASKDAIKSMPENVSYQIKSLHLKPSLQLKYITIPYYLSFLLTALRQTFGMSLAVLFYIETFINQIGIGYYIMNRWASINYPEMFAGILAISIVGILVYKVIDFLEKLLTPWKQFNKVG